MTDAEIKIHHLEWDRAKVRKSAPHPIALLKEALDALEMDTPVVALRRIRRENSLC